MRTRRKRRRRAEGGEGRGGYLKIQMFIQRLWKRVFDMKSQLKTEVDNWQLF